MENLTPLDQSLTGVDVAGLFDPSQPESLSSDERNLIGALLVTNDRVDVAIPQGMTADSLWEAFSLCCKVYSRVKRAQSQIKLLIGRALILIKDTPEIYTRCGFSSFDRFMSDELTGLPAITQISRSELYKAKTIAETFPTLSLGDSREMGFTKLSMIAQVTRESDSDSGDWVQKAKDLTIPELKKEIYRSDKQIPEGSLDWDVVQFQVTKDQKERIESFLADETIQGYCQGKAPGLIFERMISECEGEWRAGYVSDAEWERS
jgi:hypothetical protein